MTKRQTVENNLLSVKVLGHQKEIKLKLIFLCEFLKFSTSIVQITKLVAYLGIDNGQKVHTHAIYLLILAIFYILVQGER